MCILYAVAVILEKYPALTFRPWITFVVIVSSFLWMEFFSEKLTSVRFVHQAEIKKMMEMRQRELRGKHAASGESVQSPTKRSRGEKENEVDSSGERMPSSPAKVQGFMAKFAVSPKSARKNMTTLTETSDSSEAAPSTKTRFTELSRRY